MQIAGNSIDLATRTYGIAQLQIHIIMLYHLCQHMVTQKELLCVMSCGSMSHIHVQHGYVCPQIAINSTYIQC